MSPSLCWQHHLSGRFHCSQSRPLSSLLVGTQTASGGTSAGASLAAIVSPFAALRMDPLQEGDEASQGSPMRPGHSLSAGHQGPTAAPAGFMAAPAGSGEAL